MQITSISTETYYDLYNPLLNSYIATGRYAITIEGDFDTFEEMGTFITMVHHLKYIYSIFVITNFTLSGESLSPNPNLMLNGMLPDVYKYTFRLSGFVDENFKANPESVHTLLLSQMPKKALLKKNGEA